MERNVNEALLRIRRLVKDRDILQRAIDNLVVSLRSPDMDSTCDATWQQIGDALGVTRGAAQQKYRHTSGGFDGLDDA